ncbi:MAG: ferredoxin [Solirubrobacteraceae bacterium]
MSYRVEIDGPACAAHGDCVEIAPEVFQLDDVARVIGTGSEELMLAAAQACPSTAIMLLDEGTGEQLFP